MIYRREPPAQERRRPELREIYARELAATGEYLIRNAEKIAESYDDASRIWLIADMAPDQLTCISLEAEIQIAEKNGDVHAIKPYIGYYDAVPPEDGKIPGGGANEQDREALRETHGR